MKLTTLLLCLLLLLVVVEAARKPKKPKSKPKPKPKAKPKAKGKPKPKGKTNPMAIFTPYTKEKRGGVCWWDITRTDCAICKQYVNAMPCGYPLHNFCYKKSKQGCPKIPNSEYTLSTTGYPCYWDHNDKRCAWCAPGAFQCGPGPKTGPDSGQGNRCDKGPTSVCNGVVGDCRHIPSCHLDADCVFKEKIDGRSLFQCKCKKGFFGNGIQCASEDTGAVGVDPNTMVTVKATLTRDYYGKNSGNFPEPSRALAKEIEKINTECTAKFSKCQTNLNVTIKG